MSWVTVVWSMIAATCLTLAAVHGVVWWWRRDAWANLLFALTALATTFFAAGEMWMMQATTPEHFATAVRWTHVPLFVLVVALVGFVVKVQQGMTSLAIAFRVIDDRRWFLDVYAGARYNYFGINVDTSVDSSGIQGISEGATARIVNRIGQTADAILAANAAAAPSEIAGPTGKTLTGKNLERIAALPKDVRRSLGSRGLKALQRLQTSGSFQELLAAVAESRIAAAKRQLTSAIQNRLSKAQNKFSRELANTIEDALPTSAEGSKWWIDPIIGLRAQANITRWLFLAVQGDVGGFGAGSDIAWNVSGSLGVNITRHIFAEAGYRYFYMDYSDGGALYKAAESGIFSGIGVRF